VKYRGFCEAIMVSHWVNIGVFLEVFILRNNPPGTGWMNAFLNILKIN
jgi:hypothetical protein